MGPDLGGRHEAGEGDVVLHDGGQRQQPPLGQVDADPVADPLHAPRVHTYTAGRLHLPVIRDLGRAHGAKQQTRVNNRVHACMHAFLALCLCGDLGRAHACCGCEKTNTNGQKVRSV